MQTLIIVNIYAFIWFLGQNHIENITEQIKNKQTEVNLLLKNKFKKNLHYDMISNIVYIN